MRSKWDYHINKVEGKPSKFGTGAHVILPKEWLKKVVVTVTKETWDRLEALQNENQG